MYPPYLHFSNIKYQRSRKNLPPLVSANSKGYSAHLLIIRLVEEWREKLLDGNLTVGAVLMNLSKAFDCTYNNLIIAKLAVYRMRSSALTLMYSLLLLLLLL